MRAPRRPANCRHGIPRTPSVFSPQPIELDVLSQESVDRAVAKIIATHGNIDVVVHNAGHMVFGPAEAFTPEQLAELYDINVLSTQRVNRAILPQLRKQQMDYWCGCRAAVPPAAHRRISPPTLPRRREWMRWRSFTRESSRCGALKHQLSSLGRLPVGQIISRTQAGRLTKLEPLSMRSWPIRQLWKKDHESVLCDRSARRRCCSSWRCNCENRRHAVRQTFLRVHIDPTQRCWSLSRSSTI